MITYDNVLTDAINLANILVAEDGLDEKDATGEALAEILLDGEYFEAVATHNGLMNEAVSWLLCNPRVILQTAQEIYEAVYYANNQ